MCTILGLPKHNKPRLYMALYHRPDHDLEPPNWKLTFDPALKADPALRYETSLLLLPKTFDPSSSEHVGMRYYIDQELPKDSSPGLVWKFHARTTRAKPNRLCALMYLGKVEEDEEILREVVERVLLPLDVPDEVREASKTRSRGWALDVIMCLSRARVIDSLPQNEDGLVDPMRIWESLVKLAYDNELSIELGHPIPTCSTDGTRIKSIMGEED